MNGLPIYLTSESLYLGDLPVGEWVKAGSVSLVNRDYIDWELTCTLRVVPCGRVVGADLAVTTDGVAVGEDRLPSDATPPVALPTTPGSVIDSAADCDDPIYWVLLENSRWYGRNYLTKQADDLDAADFSGQWRVVFDASEAV